MNDRNDVSVEAATDTVAAIVERVEEAVVVDRSVLEAVLSAVFARGHVLLEDVPGTGKTVTARVLAEALDLEFKRIQFTPDLLPSDVTGSTIFNEHEGRFEFAEGPVFTNVVLADEINRAPPKTQAALLEAMEERQVSVDGRTYELPRPFVVIATQNPVEQEGTFRLPEAQRDRFSVKTSIGYPDFDGEMDLLDRRANRRSHAPTVDPVVDVTTVRALQERTEDVTVDEKVRRYVIALARATREDERAEIGVSPRGVQKVFEAARARAMMVGRDYVTPDDVKRLAQATMAHRVVLTTEATVEGARGSDVVKRALDSVDVPAVAPGSDAPDPATEAEPGPERAGDGASSPNRAAESSPEAEHRAQSGSEGGPEPASRVATSDDRRSGVGSNAGEEWRRG